MRIRTWRNLVKQGVCSIFRNRVMVLAAISAIMASLFVLGLVLIIVFNMNHFMDNLGSKVEITFFMDKDSTYDDVRNIEAQIKGWEGVAEITFTSKEQALEKMREMLGNRLDAIDNDNNPFPASFIIRAEKPEYVKPLVENVRRLPMVERVNYSQEVTDLIDKIINVTRIIGLLVVALLAVIACIIIHNIIKLTVFSKRKEINIMKYIGATDGYIRWPFIIQGFTLGVIGALLSTALLKIIYQYIMSRMGTNMTQGIFSMFQLLPAQTFIYNILYIFLIVGCLEGVIASYISIYKHLKV